VNESKPGKSWDGEHETLGNAKCEAHVEARTKAQRRCKKKGVQRCSICVFKSIRKKYATFSLLFHFSFLVFHCDFRQKKITQLKILKS
jgi:hypothetical protein